LYGHDAPRIFHAGGDGAQVHGYHRIELLQINLGNGGELRASPSVVSQAIEAAKAVHGIVNHRLDVGFDGDICAYEARSIAELPRELLSSVLAPSGNHYLGAFGDEKARRCGHRCRLSRRL
jgi:hypothetical protein